MDQASKVVSIRRMDGDVGAIPFDTPAMKRLKAERSHRRTTRYVEGAIPWSIITAASRAHPMGLALYLAIKMVIDTTGNPEVAVPSDLCADLGIGREMKRRILRALANAGLITISQSPGRLTRVRLAPIATDKADKVARPCNEQEGQKHE